MMESTIVTLITGTRKGIGEYLAKYYLSKGHIVIGCSRSTPDWCKEGYDNYCHYILDVADEAAVKKMFMDIRKTYGHLDHLINNAGIAAMNHCALTPMQMVDNVFSTNTKGTFLFSREAYKIMKKNKYGRIINFSTVAVPLKLDGEAAYAASKAAIVTLTQIMAKEFGNDGVTVNAVGPTPVQTDLIRNVPEEKIQRLLNNQSVKRFGTFEDVSNVIDFYLDKRSSFITGQVIYLGGI
jgi:3-oxoacyl-[acyl-carrier protein] reductase